MQQIIKKIQKQWNMLSQRETMAVIAALVAAVFVLWSVVIFEPYRENVRLLELELQQTEGKVAGVSA